MRGPLNFLSPNAVKPVVVFTAEAEFKTDIPTGVLTVGQLADYLRRETEMIMSLDQLHCCVGRLETARLAISRETVAWTVRRALGGVRVEVASHWTNGSFRTKLDPPPTHQLP